MRLVLSCIVPIFITVTVFAQGRIDADIFQADPRFEVSAYHHFNTTSGYEKVFFNVQNNTDDEYHLVIEANVVYSCNRRKTFQLGVNRVVVLKSGGRFTPSQDWDHSMETKDKSCWIKSGNGQLTTVDNISIRIISIKNITEDNAKKKGAAAAMVTTAKTNGKSGADDINDPKASVNAPSSKQTGAAPIAGAASAERKNVTTANKDSVAEGWTYQDAVNYINKSDAQRQAKYDQVAAESAKQKEKMNLSFQSYYAAQAVTNARNGITENATLQGNFSSKEELEQAFQQRLRAVGMSAQSLAESNRNYIQATKEYFTYNGSTKTQAIGELAGGVLNIINDAQARKAERLAKENLEMERKEQLARMERERKQQLLSARQGFLNLFPDGGVPLSSHKIDINELYFFSYIYTPALLGQDSTTMLVSNVFPLSRYSDGTWPFKNNIMQSITKMGNGSDKPVLVGYYVSEEKAIEMRNSFLNLAAKCNMKIVNISVKGKKATGAQQDFWGNGNEAGKGTVPTKQADDDFWETGGKSNGKPPSQKPSTKKQDDFWNN